MDGLLVTWDHFRYAQHLAGDLHLFDPKTGKGEPCEHEHPHHEHNLEVAATWEVPLGDRARDRLAKLREGREKAALQSATASAAPRVELGKFIPAAQQSEKTAAPQSDPPRERFVALQYESKSVSENST
jgi:hypothetical protein